MNTPDDEQQHLTLKKLDQFTFTDDHSYHRTLTCVNHQELRWTTKNPYERSIFFLGAVGDTDHAVPECECPFPDLRVIVEQSQEPHRVKPSHKQPKQPKEATA